MDKYSEFFSLKVTPHVSFAGSQVVLLVEHPVMLWKKGVTCSYCWLSVTGLREGSTCQTGGFDQ